MKTYSHQKSKIGTIITYLPRQVHLFNFSRVKFTDDNLVGMELVDNSLLTIIIRFKRLQAHACEIKQVPTIAGLSLFLGIKTKRSFRVVKKMCFFLIKLLYLDVVFYSQYKQVVKNVQLPQPRLLSEMYSEISSTNGCYESGLGSHNLQYLPSVST